MSEDTLPGAASSDEEETAAEADEDGDAAEEDFDADDDFDYDEDAEDGNEEDGDSPEPVPHPRPARFVAPALAWVFPGAGHLYLGRRGKALVFFLVVAFMLIMGLALDGKIYAPRDGDMFAWFGSYACLGLGPAYFVLKAFSFSLGDPFSAWAEYGNRFVLTAGIMNLLLMLDAFDLAVGRRNKSL